LEPNENMLICAQALSQVNKVPEIVFLNAFERAELERFKPSPINA
jgi:hypothetical protein